MNLESLKAGDGWGTYSKWREYVALAKKNPKDQMIKEMRNVYNHAKRGHKLIDIRTAMKAGGIKWVMHNDNRWQVPNLAICPATAKTVICNYLMNGTLRFQDSYRSKRSDIKLDNIVESYTWSDGSTYRSKELTALVPIVPKTIWRKPLQNDHYIIWEVDKWTTKEASLDPALLKRLSKFVFVVLAEWELTPLEKSVIDGHI